MNCEPPNQLSPSVSQSLSAVLPHPPRADNLFVSRIRGHAGPSVPQQSREPWSPASVGVQQKGCMSSCAPYLHAEKGGPSLASHGHPALLCWGPSTRGWEQVAQWQLPSSATPAVGVAWGARPCLGAHLLCSHPCHPLAWLPPPSP